MWEPIIKGFNIEGLVNLSDSISVSIVPGASVVNRTMDQGSMDAIVAEINNYPLADRFFPKYNVYLFQLYNTLTYKNVSLYTEYAGKSADVFIGYNDSLQSRTGNSIFTTLTYSRKGFGMTLGYKRTENFTFRTSPNEILFQGMGNFLPPIARQNTYRLVARYQPATQDVGEQGLQLDVTWALKKWLVLSINYSEISQLNNQRVVNITPEFAPTLPETNLFGLRPWYREFQFDFEMRKSRKFKAILGHQYVNYDLDFYQNKPGKDVVEAYVPFTELTYKISRKKSLRMELSYMATDEDFGSWFYALIEYNIAPTWSWGGTVMWNSGPTTPGNDIVYPSVYGSYTKKATKFILSYVKQVEGIVCTGGVCRLEPAFSGARFSATTSF
jgi:hypothetical protein